jgi:hypothetical protein
VIAIVNVPNSIDKKTKAAAGRVSTVRAARNKRLGLAGDCGTGAAGRSSNVAIS